MAERGIDVSSAQERVDWQRVKAAGYRFAIVRATQGGRTSRPVGLDVRFRQHIDGALSAGLLVGVYHAFLGGRDGGEQADFYLETIADFLPVLALRPAVDVEIANGQPPGVVADRLQAMLSALESSLHYKALVYTAAGVWNGMVGAQHDAYFAQHPLWVANYTSAPAPALPRCWRSWVAWQYSNKAQVPGVSSPTVDINRLADDWADTLAVG